MKQTFKASSVKHNIRIAFDLTDENLDVTVKKDIHWEIKMGYGE